MTSWTSTPRCSPHDRRLRRNRSVRRSVQVLPPPEEISSYGCADPEPTDRPDLVRLRGIVEKPKAEDAPSDLAVMGRYLFTGEIFDALDRTNRAWGEIQLTDAIAILLAEQPVYGFVFDEAASTSGRSSTTCGPPSSWRWTVRTSVPSSASSSPRSCGAGASSDPQSRRRAVALGWPRGPSRSPRPRLGWLRTARTRECAGHRRDRTGAGGGRGGRRGDPPFVNTAMDGYAVRAEDVAPAPVTLPVVAEVAAGHLATCPLGRARRCASSPAAPLPDGADAVAGVVERTERLDSGKSVRIDAAVEAGTHLREVGEDPSRARSCCPPATRSRPAGSACWPCWASPRSWPIPGPGWASCPPATSWCRDQGRCGSARSGTATGPRCWPWRPRPGSYRSTWAGCPTTRMPSACHRAGRRRLRR